MGFDFSGYVIRPPRGAPSNATTTGDARTGVLRDIRDLPSSYDLPGDLVEVSADQYRSAVLRNPDGTTQEYLVWAANNSSLTVIEDTSFTTTDPDPTKTVSIPTGTLDVNAVPPTVYTDGTDSLVIVNQNGLGIADVRLISIVRGDTGGQVDVGPDAPTDFESQDASSGIVKLGTTTLASLDGGVSKDRGDTIVRVDYVISSARFWWTRNDSASTRFGWNGKTQRWEPFKGGSPKNLGLLLEGVGYTLTPRPIRFKVGDYLPGDSGDSDSYSMVRLGSSPDANSFPVSEPVVGGFGGILVVSDDTIDLADAGSYTYGTEAAILGVSNGELRFNPSFVVVHIGDTIWYSFEDFQEDSKGILGRLKGANDDPLFLAPIPEVTDRPLLRLGSRRHLSPIQVDTDAELNALDPGIDLVEGQFAWSRSTGKLLFSTADVEKADPDKSGFDVQYVGNSIIYDGVTLTQEALSTRQAVQLVDKDNNPTTVDSNNDMYVPEAVPLPSPGVSGVMFVHDQTGTLPNTNSSPGVRPQGSGLVRELLGVGDTIIFTASKALKTLDVVGTDDDLSKFDFRIREGTVEVSKSSTGLPTSSPTTTGSKIGLGNKDRRSLKGEEIYFLQADLQPAVYASKARILSRQRDPFTLDGSEVLAFAIDGFLYTWTNTLGSGSFSADDVASDMDSVVTNTGRVIARNGRIHIEAGDLNTGSVEIGFGSTTSGSLSDRDLSGSSALGFLPGWRVEDPSTKVNWLPDSGISLGVFRSPQNKDRSRGIPDFRSLARFENIPLSTSVIANPFFNLTNPPLQDIAGYGEDVFFLIAEGLFLRFLRNFEDVFYEFGEDRFHWVEGGNFNTRVETPLTVLDLGNTGVIEDSLHPSVVSGGGLYVDADGSTKTQQTLGKDFLLVGDGVPGQALLIDVIGGEKASGSNGSFTAGGTTFSDPDATFISDGIGGGYLLKVLSGDSEGYFVVASVSSETVLDINSDVLFLSTDSRVSWEIYEGFPDSVYDPAIIADAVYEEFNHLSEEPFKIRLLSSVGVIPQTPAQQTSNRLQAVVKDALERNRILSIRFGSEIGGPESSLSELETVALGVVSNDSLSVPDTSDDHFVGSKFSVRVGIRVYSVDYPATGGGPLVPVSVFSDPLSGDQVEYGEPGSGAIEGQLKFGEDTLADLSGSEVYYTEEFLDPLILSAGTVEVDPSTGLLNFSSGDMNTYGGSTTGYFNEQMITEKQLDVVVSPIQGAIYFNKPLRSGQIVEVEYFKADTNGSQVIDDTGSAVKQVEQLPLFLRQQEAVYVEDGRFSINPDGRTIRDDVDFQVWVDGRLQNYGNTTTAVLSTEANEIHFNDDVEAVSVSTVQVNYAVLEASGGETTYTTSTSPVYRPPFFLEAGQTEFTLEGDRTSEMVPGKIFRLGPTPFYIKESSYNGTTGDTQVTVWPPSDFEAGSRSPGNDSLSLLSDGPVTTDVDGVPTGGPAGFLLDVSTVTNPYEPVDKGMLSIVFQGDLTTFAVAGHLLEIGGHPLIIASAELTEDGLYTRIDTTSPFRKGFDPLVDAVKISVRPIYPPGSRDFLGINPVVDSEEIELILFGEEESGVPQPGRVLTRTTAYEIDTDTGDVTLLSPLQNPLGPGQKLILRNTKLGVLSPFLADGGVIFPTYRATYIHTTTPDEDNGFLGARLLGTYTFYSPDSFFFRAVPLQTYMGEVAQQVVDSVAANLPYGGPVVTSGPRQENYSFGSLSLLNERSDLTDRDRASRAFIDFYNGVIVSFEQIRETINGEVIGDRDGKFRFFIGREKDYPPPGYEDPITGSLNPRNVWLEIMRSVNGDIKWSDEDDIVNPETATQDPITYEVTGDFLDPFLIGLYRDQQRSLIKNDMDDYVLIRIRRPRLSFGFPFPDISAKGVFEQMWSPHSFSRLFPEQALAFTTTFPGLGADLPNGDVGVYSFLKMLEPPKILKGQGAVVGTSFRQPIGSVANPVLGVIHNVNNVGVRKRLPRARVWAYSETGFPELDGLLSAAGKTTFSSQPRPAVIATPLFLKDFPIDPDTGFPDVSRLGSQGGDLPDLSTGDPDLSTPPFLEYDRGDLLGRGRVMQQLAFGRPDGTTFGVGSSRGFLSSVLSSVTIDPVLKGVFVQEVLLGCVITFTDGAIFGGTATVIEDGGDIITLGIEGSDGSPLTLSRGDTIYVIPTGSADTDGMTGDPPTLDEMQDILDHKTNYAVFFDIGVNKRDGEFRDISLPSVFDPSPFPLKELTGQRGPNPLETIEADVEFTNTGRIPISFPALKGETTNDDGDFSIPYLSILNTELDRLGAVADTFTSITQIDSPTPQSVYPDEVIGSDGSIISPASGSTPPARLLTSVDLRPTGGSYTAYSGIGDPARYDLLLVETGQTTIDTGAQGILTIGDVNSSVGELEVPRFITGTRLGDPIEYIFSNAMTHVSSTGVSGMALDEPGGTSTTLSIPTVGGLVFNDGVGAAIAGGLNNIIPFGSTNSITIHIYENLSGGSPGSLLETIILTGTSATGGLGTVALAAGVTFSDDTITIPVVGFVDFAALGGGPPAGPFDFTLSIDTTGSSSTTGFIDGDRLTFSEKYDMRTAEGRGVTNAGSVVIEASLDVVGVTASGSTGTTVNDASSINGGTPLTFLSSSGLSTSVGGFTPATGSGAGDETGTVRAMSWEGSGNTPIITTGDVVFSAIPSSDEDASGTICSGTTNTADGTNYLDGDTGVLVITGSVSNIKSGDILVIDESDAGTGEGAIKVGTYIIRHAVEESGGTGGAHEVDSTISAGITGGWASIRFPKVVTSTSTPFELVVDGIQEVPDSPSSYDFPSSGTLYVIKDPTDLSTSVGVDYASFSVDGTTGQVTFTLTTGTAFDATGGGIADAVFSSTAGVGDRVGGMIYIPIGQYKSGFPTNNVVGNTSVGPPTIAGFWHVTLNNTELSGTAQVFTAGVDLVAGTPAATELGIGVPTPTPSTSFVSSSSTVVYSDVATYVDLSGISGGAGGQWHNIHGGSATATNIDTVVPGDLFATNDNAGTAGFYAQAGIFIEPSTPTPTQDLGNSEAKVVDSTHSILTGAVGMRDAVVYGGVSPEGVHFVVRRIRRWHDVQEGIGDNLGPLRYAYEIRQGNVATYDDSDPSAPLLIADLSTYGSATQLGDFDDPDVNIHAGDIVRVFGSDGNVDDEAEIASVIDGDTLQLVPPGFENNPPSGGSPGDGFHVFLNQPPVPHEQSNQQLFEIITDEVIIQQNAVPNTAGGSVSTTNVLTDLDPTVDYSLLGVQEGDILVVDPAGVLEGPTGSPTPAEKGSRPFGDVSVPDRGPGDPYVSGGPSELDDNRGWYRVTSVTPSSLEVTGETEYTGSNGSDVVFGDVGQEFAVYPTISGSNLTGDTEGQMDLRPTSQADGSNSYKGTDESIEPFSYRVIRPSPLFTDEAIDLVLMHRERILSWMEELEVASLGNKQGVYFIFQKDDHASDLGDPTDSDDGLGVASNAFINSLSGLSDTAPFANVSDSQSVLDRRYWCLDLRLDNMVPPNSGGSVPYSSFEDDALSAGLSVGSGRPVLPDRIEDILDRIDRFRDLRFVWIKYRTELVDGTLPSVSRFDKELPERIQEQEDLLLLQEGLDEVE